MSTLKSYTTGFVLSIILTLLAYITVVDHLLGGQLMLYTISLLAMIQLVVQLVFFLHLNTAESRWNRLVFAFMLIVVLILVVGSLWIMHNLNTHMLTPAQIDNYMSSQDGL